MNQVLNTLVYLFVGYLVGLWLAAPGLFSATVTLTAWGNLWVYVWLLFWPFILFWYATIWVLVIAALVALVYYLFGQR
jgi:hypothetical protein